MKTIIIGDLHGDWHGLLAILRATGAIDANGERLPDTKVVQLGDLVHGGGLPLRDGVDDRRCAELAFDLCDVVLVGNHELSHLWPDAGFPRFGGMREPARETLVALHALRHAGKLVAAYAHDGWLLTHAGLHADFVLADYRADFAAERLSFFFRGRCERASGQDLFDAVGTLRGGSERYGGIFWCDWLELKQLPTVLPQIVGHTPQVDGYAHTGNLWCVDAGAALSGRVGALVQDELGGEWLPVVVESEDR